MKNILLTSLIAGAIGLLGGTGVVRAQQLTESEGIRPQLQRWLGQAGGGAKALCHAFLNPTHNNQQSSQ